MDAQEIKQKILDGELNEEELTSLLAHGRRSTKPRGGFMKTLLKGFIDGYTTPQLYRALMEAALIFMVIAGIVALTWVGKLDMTLCAVFLALVLGYLFGKTR